MTVNILTGIKQNRISNTIFYDSFNVKKKHKQDEVIEIFTRRPQRQTSSKADRKTSRHKCSIRNKIDSKTSFW